MLDFNFQSFCIHSSFSSFFIIRLLAKINFIFGLFFRFLDYIHQHNYFQGIKAAFSSWYLLMYIFIAVLSPILVKAPFSLCLVNFAMYFLASVSVARLAYYLKADRNFVFISGLIPWFFPIIYGYTNFLSLPVLALDAIFLGALYVAVANTLVYFCNPKSFKNAVIAGLATGMAFLGRGNSFLAVGTISCIPVLYGIYSYILKNNKGNKREQYYFFIYLLLSLVIGGFYYVRFWDVIYGYYAPIANISTHYPWSLSASIAYFNNVPGMFFYYHADSPMTAIVGHIINIFLIYAAYKVFKNRDKLDSYKKNILLTLGTGLFIYLFTYLLVCLFFSKLTTLSFINNVTPSLPMLIGITLILLSYIMMMFKLYRPKIKLSFVIFISIFLLFYGHFMAKLHVPIQSMDRPTPATLQLVVKQLHTMADGGTINILWNQAYNMPIFEYYALQGNILGINAYASEAGPVYGKMWVPYMYSKQYTEVIKQVISLSLENARLTILPAKITSYKNSRTKDGGTYGIYYFDQFIVDFLRTRANHYMIRMVLWDSPMDPLLVIEQKKFAAKQGVLLSANYGYMSNNFVRQLKVPQF